MIPLLLVAFLFTYLSVIGQAVVSLFRPRTGVLWSWFAAPSIGLCLLLVVLTRLNVWGIPIRTAGPWATIALLVVAVVILAWRRPKLPLRKMAPFLIIAAGSLIYTGWPALRFGFNWISYGNDDMANYCLAAERFLAHGYYDVPFQTDLEGRDYAQHYWFMHALQQIRPGSEIAVAWVSSLTGKHAHEVFMPTILMLSLMQLFGLGCVAIWKGRYRKMAILAFFLFATSPLFSLGTLYQLIAQVGGLALLLVIGSMLFRSRVPNVRTMLVAGILTAGLGIYYPEVSPFVALGVILVALRFWAFERRKLGLYTLFISGVAALTFILIASNTYEFINTLVMQSAGSAGLGEMAEINDQSGGLVLFPWTLVPSFLPMLFGLHPFGKVGVDPLISCQIVAGVALLAYFGWRTWRNLMDGAPSGYLGTVMIVLGIYLFQKGQDFGLFKLAMYAQPVITLCLAQGFAIFLFSPTAKVRQRAKYAVGLFFCCTAVSQIYYSYASLGTYGGGLTEVVKGSQLGVGFNPPKNLKYEGIESDISNVVSAKMLAMYTGGIDTRFLSRSYMDNIANIAVLKFLRTPDPDLGPQARLVQKLALLRFMLPPELLKDDIPDYRVVTIHKEANSVVYANNWTETSSRHLDNNDRLFVSIRTDLDHFNKWNNGDGWTNQGMYQYKLESQVKDRLVFVHSELSPHYYSSARFKASFFQRESEPISDGSYFHGTGEFTEFHIVNPSKRLRMIIDFSRTSLGAGRTHLPEKAIVVGENDYKIPFVGDGSARVVTDILEPEFYEGQAYLTVDFGDPARVIEKVKTGLMRWYGVNYALDDRRLVGFTRDISVITDDQYRSMPRPLKISKFPDDLLNNKGLEYSGIYEDGWIGRDAFFRLGASHTGQVLYFKGYIPYIPRFVKDGIDATISINGKPTEIVNLKSGKFELTRLVKEATDVTSISLHFSDAQVYDTDRDKRAVSAFVDEISIEDAPDFASFRSLANSAGEKFVVNGIDADGWIGRSAEFKAPSFDGFRVLKLDVEMPGWAPIATNNMIASVDGRPIKSAVVPRQTFESVYFPLPPGPQHSVQLDAASVFPLPGDGRQRSFLIKNISFENLTQPDLFARGWHKSGYLFGIDGADTDGWVETRLALKFPATTKFTEAIVQVVRYPSKKDYPLSVKVDGKSKSERSLGLDQTETVKIPLSALKETAAELSASEEFTLGTGDSRSRSFRVVNIDFD
ncbi:MAG TPA: hypothetical protein VFE25_06355 [Opitutaceae bacterium]|nr:hypothetical protein [Opitutaceae bacterium]